MLPGGGVEGAAGRGSKGDCGGDRSSFIVSRGEVMVKRESESRQRACGRGSLRKGNKAASRQRDPDHFLPPRLFRPAPPDPCKPRRSRSLSPPAPSLSRSRSGECRESHGQREARRVWSRPPSYTQKGRGSTHPRDYAQQCLSSSRTQRDATRRDKDDREGKEGRLRPSPIGCGGCDSALQRTDASAQSTRVQ